MRQSIHYAACKLATKTTILAYNTRYAPATPIRPTPVDGIGHTLAYLVVVAHENLIASKTRHRY